MNSQPSHHSIQYGTTIIDYQLTFKERETLAIHVNPDTQVMVEAPLGSNFSLVEEKIHKRSAWIIKQQKNFQRYSYELPPRQYVSGESHRYLGRQYRLKVMKSEGGKEIVKMDRGRILIYTKKTKDRERIKKLLEEWYREHAKRIYDERVSIWHPRFERFGTAKPHVVVRKMKSRWGSCTGDEKITLNLKLIQVPKQYIDYVIVHELSHLIEHNHSTDFYKLMDRILPDWKDRREKLNMFEF